MNIGSLVKFTSQKFKNKIGIIKDIEYRNNEENEYLVYVEGKSYYFIKLELEVFDV